jgi:hypothetical protein
VTASPYCGRDNDPGAQLCIECGKPLHQAARLKVPPAGLLAAVIDRPTAGILNPLVYNTPAVRCRDRAFAACLTAQAYRPCHADLRAFEWAQQGLQRDTRLGLRQQIVQRPGGS